MDELGLFPLGIVLLPTEQLPLHIFEERYKDLIGECLEADTEFGLVYADDEGIRDVGTRARIVDVLTRFEDGRLNILVEGGERFHLDELTEGRSFHTGRVSTLEDDADPAEAEAIEDALRMFGVLRELTGSEVEPPDDRSATTLVCAGRQGGASGGRQAGASARAVGAAAGRARAGAARGSGPDGSARAAGRRARGDERQGGHRVAARACAGRRGVGLGPGGTMAPWP